VVPDHPVLSVITGLPRPRWRGLIHTWAFWITIPAVAVLIFVSRSIDGRIGAIVFGASLVALYGSSAAYHRLARTERAQRIMRRLDHSMIFVLIAGTYTPVCLVALPSRWSIPVLGAVWAFAAVGIATKILGTDWTLKVSNSLYLVLGWLGVVALPILFRTIHPLALAFLLLGGVLYTVGAVLFFLRRPDPLPTVFGYHEVWHTFTVLAGASHFAMVAIITHSSGVPGV